MFVIMLLASIGASAQRVDKPGEPYDVYCVIEHVTSSLPIISIGGSVKDLYLYGEDDKMIEFKSITDVITYFSKRGWVFVDFCDTYRSALMMKKTVRSDSDALENLDLDKFKRKKK